MMTKVDILNWEKTKIGEVDLNPDIFNQKVRLDILSDIVRWQRAKKRQGSHNVKTRGDVRGGGAKPFRQKGTGRARQGSIRSPLLRGGGVAHGPHPRDYSTKISAKVRKFGVKSALSYIYEQKSLFIVEDMVSKDGKTKELFRRLKNFGLEKALLIDQEKDVCFARACRNLPYYQLSLVRGLNVFDLLKYKQVVFSKKGLEKLNQVYGGEKS